MTSRAACLAVLLATVAAPAVDLLPVAEVRAGMTGYGLTVYRGTTIERFNVTILGVLPKADFDGDWIMARVTSGPLLDRQSGILAGMSGSPIYVNERLVGAVAYATTWSSEPIAFLTPIHDMLRVLEASREERPATRAALRELPLPQPVVVAGQARDRVVVAAAGVPDGYRPPGDALLVEPVGAPVMVSGLGAQGLAALTELLRPYRLWPVQGPGGGADQPAADLVPGAAMGVALAGGDVSATAIGTVTWRDGDRILGFGHPMMQRNRVAIPLTGATIVDFITGAQRSMKIGTATGVVGTLVEDGHWAVAGQLGVQAPTIPLTVTVHDADARRSRTVRCHLVDDDLLAPGLALGIAADAVGTWVGVSPRTMFRTTTEVRLSGAEPLQLREEGLLTAGGANAALADLQAALQTSLNNPFGPVRLEGVTVGVELRRGDTTALISRAYVDRSVVKPGDSLQVELDVRRRSDGQVTRHRLTVPVPLKAPRGKARLAIAGGAAERSLAEQLKLLDPPPQSTAQALRRLADRDADSRRLVALLALPQTDLAVRGERFPAPPAFFEDLLANAGSTDLVRGQTALTVAQPCDLVILNAATANVTIGDLAETQPAAQPSAVAVLPGFPAADLAAVPAWVAAAVPASVRPAAAMGDAGAGPPAGQPAPSGQPDKPAAPKEPAKDEESPSRAPRVWVHNSAKDFLAGELQGTSVVAEGSVVLGLGVERVATGHEPVFWDVAVAPDGTAWIGSGNNGELLRAGADGPLTVAARVGQPLITAVACAPDGVWFASAPDGVIHHLAADGRVTEVTRTGASYVWELLPTAAGLVAATGQPARLLRWRDGRLEVLAEPDSGHVLAVAAGPGGELYAAGGAPGFVIRVRDGQRDVLASTKDPVTALAVLDDGSLLYGDGAALVKRPPSGPPRVEPPLDGPAILALQPTPAGVLVAVRAKTAPGPAAIWVYEPATGQRRRAALADSFAVTDLALTPQGAVLATCGAPAQLCRLTLPYTRQGTYESAVLDAGAAAAWGAVEAVCTTPSGGAVTVETRSGQSATPGDDWSPWMTAVQAVHSPPARYLQYRLLLAAGAGGTPVVESVRLWYVTLNAAPQVTIEAPQLGDAWRGKATIKWKLTDPNNDPAGLSIAVQPVTGGEWQTVAENLAASLAKHEWDTAKLADGRYRLRLTADDGVANPDSPLTATELSDVFLIDNTAPTASLPVLTLTAERLAITATVRDNLLLRGADWRLDTGPWQPARARDGLFDTDLETVVIRTPPVKPGQHSLELRVRDAAGNEKVVKATVTGPAG